MCRAGQDWLDQGNQVSLESGLEIGPIGQAFRPLEVSFRHPEGNKFLMKTTCLRTIVLEIGRSNDPDITPEQVLNKCRYQPHPS